MPGWNIPESTRSMIRRVLQEGDAHAVRELLPMAAYEAGAENQAGAVERLGNTIEGMVAREDA